MRGWKPWSNLEVVSRDGIWLKKDGQLRALRLFFDQRWRLVALETVGPVCQAERVIVSGSMGEETIYARFARPYAPGPRRVHLFPEAAFAFVTECDSWGCTLHKLNGGTRHHSYLGGVPGEVLGYQKRSVVPIGELASRSRTPDSPLSLDRGGPPLRAQRWPDGSWWRVLQGERVLVQTRSGLPGTLGTRRQDALVIFGPPLEELGPACVWDIEVPKGKSWWDGRFRYLKVRFDREGHATEIQPLEDLSPQPPLR